MKKMILSLLMVASIFSSGYAQNANQQLQAAVAKLANAEKVKDYIQLAGEFEQMANDDPGNWLPDYYAAFCNAKIGWLYQDDGEKIEPFADKAEEHINRVLQQLDTSKQKTELSEVYCIKSMLNRARVFVNPMTQGRKYGPAAFQYLQMALRINPANPRAIYLDGWEKFYTPKMYGGDKKKAKELLQKAIAGLNAEQLPANYPHWGKKEAEELLTKLK